MSLADVIETADGVAERPNAVPALLALTRLVGRAFASEHMLEQVGGSANCLLVDWVHLAHRYRLPSERGDDERVWLGFDPVVAVPWNTGRLIENLSRLSLGPPGKPCEAEPWSYDSRNHEIKLWLPMRLAEVWNGYHSVVAGVLSNTGSVPARSIYDFSPLFTRLSWNGGLSWTDSESGGIAQVRDWRLASIRTGPPIARSWLQWSFSGLRAGRERLTMSPNFLGNLSAAASKQPAAVGPGLP